MEMNSKRGSGRIYKPNYKRPDGSIYECATWWIGYYHRGKQIRESSKSQSEAQARKLLDQRLSEIKQGKLMSRPTRLLSRKWPRIS